MTLKKSIPFALVLAIMANYLFYPATLALNALVFSAISSVFLYYSYPDLSIKKRLGILTPHLLSAIYISFYPQGISYAFWFISFFMKQMKTKCLSKLFIIALFTLSSIPAAAISLLIPMDAEGQKEHLKAYGIAYQALEKGIEIEWLLNYRGGSFLIPLDEGIKLECKIRNVSYEVIGEADAQAIRETINSPALNQSIVKLQTAPKIAVYSPKSKQPCIHSQYVKELLLPLNRIQPYLPI